MDRNQTHKVLHVVVAGAVGGAEQFLVNLATRPALCGADHVVALMTPNPKLRALFHAAGLDVRDRGPVRENPVATLWRSFGPADLAWLTRLIAAERPDLLHCHTYGSHLLAARAGRRCKIPVVRTEHGTRHYRDPTCGLGRHWALAHTDCIAAISDYVGRFVAGVAPGAVQKIRVVHNGIDMSRFSPAPPPENAHFTFAAVGRLDPVKRLTIAIDAIAATPDAHLDIVGDGGERTMLERRVDRLGLRERVRFLGHHDDPRTAIAGCDALINCTLAEGLGLAILEAAAMGRPTLGFAGGGIPEVVQHEVTGWLVERDTPQAWAEGLRAAAASRATAARLGTTARAHVAERFTIEAMCRGYGAVYGELSR